MTPPNVPLADLRADLAEGWERSGVAAGDMLLLHCDPRRTLRRLRHLNARVSLDDLLDTFLAALGPSGTLILPTFNFDFTRGVPFDVRSTPSHTGVLTEHARRRPDAVRTGHAIYSFAVIGAQAPHFRNFLNRSSYGADSPFQSLREAGGKIAVLDLPDVNSMTFYHHVEEILGAHYRRHKTFTGQYTDWSGHTSVREFDIFVRSPGVETDVDPMGEVLWQRGLYSGSRPGVGIGLRVIDSAKMFSAVAEVIRSGRAKGFLYRVE